MEHNCITLSQVKDRFLDLVLTMKIDGLPIVTWYNPKECEAPFKCRIVVEDDETNPIPKVENYTRRMLDKYWPSVEVSEFEYTRPRLDRPEEVQCTFYISFK